MSEVRLGFVNLGWGCGFCGAIGGAPGTCCEKSREWVLRFARQLRNEMDAQDLHYASGQGDPSLEERHLEARWQRVVRRWAAA